MLNALKKYCSKSEQDTIDNLLNIFSVLDNRRFMTKQEFLNNFAQRKNRRTQRAPCRFSWKVLRKQSVTA